MSKIILCLTLALLALCAVTGCRNLGLTTQMQPEHVAAFGRVQKVQITVRTPKTRIIRTPPSDVPTAPIFMVARHTNLNAFIGGIVEPDTSSGASIGIVPVPGTKLLPAAFGTGLKGFTAAYEYPGPGSETFFATRFLIGAGLTLVEKKRDADARITFYNFLAQHEPLLRYPKDPEREDRRFSYASSMVIDCPNIRILSCEMVGHGKTPVTAFTNAGATIFAQYRYTPTEGFSSAKGFYRVFGQYVEKLCGKERAGNAWGAIVLDPAVRHGGMLDDAFDALEELARSQTRTALAALQKTKDSGPSELVRRRAAEILGRHAGAEKP